MNQALAGFVLLILALFVFAGLFKFILAKQSVAPATLPYRKRDYLLTAAERSFYEVLCSIAGDQLHVFPKVRLLDLFYLPKGTANVQSHKNRVMSKHVDFVLCDRQNVKPLLVIELDDSSHEREDRKARDSFVDQALGGAGLPILHVEAKRSYAPKELAELIEQRLG